MYTEERKSRNLLVDFILKLILIIIFVLLLIWLVPWPNMDSLNPLKDQIFNANLQTMKEAGITYFTTERLPSEVGDKTTLTLQKMLDLKLLVPFTDKNGDSCDVEASYVSLEKKDTEYLMKVNLKCGEEEDFILVHLGCYSYCTSDICEADPKSTETPSTTPKATQTTAKPSTKPTTTATVKPTVTPTVTPTIKPTTTPTPTVTPSVEKEYEYSKTTERKLSSDWKWSAKIVKKTNDGVEFVKTDTKWVRDLGYIKTQVGYTTAVYENVYVEHNEMIKYTTLAYKLCNKYNYVADSTTTYRVVTDWAATSELKYGYAADIPADTLSTKWVLESVDYDECKETCTSHPYGIWRKYTRTIEVDTEYSNVTASCTDITEKTVDVYMSVPVGTYKTVLKTAEQPIYKYVRYYQIGTKDVLEEAKTVYKWSTYNDTTLLNDGYSYTGKTRTK